MADTGVGGIGEALVAFEQIAVRTAAVGVRESGVEVVEGARGLVAALDAASVAATGMLSGPALAECADLLARRARDLEAEADTVAGGMERGVGTLVAADEEGAGRVADAAG